MSYEGYQEQLCERGHYFAQDCYEAEPKACPRCGGAIAYVNSVDQTNGTEEDDPGTYSAPRVLKGHTDIWNEDHHGNRYATKLLEFEPAPGSRWRRVGGKARKPRR